MLSWSQQYNIRCFLNNNHYTSSYHSYESLLAVGASDTLKVDNNKPFDSLKNLHEAKQDWLFGHLSYDLKNTLYGLRSNHQDYIAFPDIYFFQPEILIAITENEVNIGAINIAPEDVFANIANFKSEEIISADQAIKLQQRFSKAGYIKTVNQIKDHIHRGDCYEVNFCQEFYAEKCIISPLSVFHRLNNYSPSPYAAFYQLEDKFLMCSSPERFMKKVGSKLISQPVKGTIRRSKNNLEEEKLKEQLYLDPKERSENVMVVDLVRNDLSRNAKAGSVKVEELFGIYTYRQVHQMVSTVVAELDPQYHFTEALANAFPMGSMTGAPKFRVMQLIEEYERSKRGLFSGSVGYIDPAGDFDFNVIIRSIFYNSANRYLSCSAGSAITHYCQPEKEWEECLLKAEAIRRILASSH